MMIVVAGQVAAQDAPSAVGRISYGDKYEPGAAICTGVLVAPDLVLTARHCLASARADPASVSFAANFTDGQSVALGLGAEVILSDEAVLPNRANDVALLRMKAPMERSAVTPLSFVQTDFGTTPPDFSVIAYRRDAPARAERQDSCTPVTSSLGILALSCPVVSGNSGAPVLMWDGADWRIVAVMVASYSLGQIRSLASVVPPDLLSRIQANPLP